MQYWVDLAAKIAQRAINNYKLRWSNKDCSLLPIWSDHQNLSEKKRVLHLHFLHFGPCIFWSCKNICSGCTKIFYPPSYCRGFWLSTRCWRFSPWCLWRPCCGPPRSMGLTASPWGREWRCRTAAQCRYQTARKYGLWKIFVKTSKQFPEKNQKIVDGFFAKIKLTLPPSNYFFMVVLFDTKSKLSIRRDVWGVRHFRIYINCL